MVRRGILMEVSQKVPCRESVNILLHKLKYVGIDAVIGQIIPRLAEVFLKIIPACCDIEGEVRLVEDGNRQEYLLRILL